MPQIALLTALLLIAEGLYGYFGAAADDRSMTALIPLFFGVPIGISGLFALKDSYRMHAMHAAVSFGLLGAFAAWGRTAMTAGKMSQGIEYNQRAAAMVLIMAIICTGFVIMCVRSFIAARKRQRAEKVEE
ncbi:hypothetical protein [uncultured Rubinisphaera sp.]|uniref:hypothetical protein n=1 Tax=uncultured Rubinisphaera sp. TaxID=1678686 RepID=UPI0030D7B947|tara:strand:- start:2090 stop:2482 length:393 start_codon:yes stop_codon:yes gene_type:complete